MKNFIDKKRFTKAEENKYDDEDDEKKEEIYINNDFMIDEDQNIIVSIDNKYIFALPEEMNNMSNNFMLAISSPCNKVKFIAILSILSRNSDKKLLIISINL